MNPNNSTPNRFRAFYFALFVFLCFCDQFFAVRIHDYNFRFAQILLLCSLLPILYSLSKNPRDLFQKEPHLKLFLYWVPFFLTYSISTALSPLPAQTGIKLIWALFNIGGMALLLLCTKDWDSLKKGYLWGVGALAALIWIEFITIYFFNPGLFDVSEGPQPWYRSLLGFAQYAWVYQGQPIYRPNAFFYEPSYAGSALTPIFALAIALAVKKNSISTRAALFCAFIFCAIWFTTSRTAILGLALGLGITLTYSIFKNKELFKSMCKVLFISLLFLALVSAGQGPRKYAAFFMDITDPKSMSVRLSDKTESEGWRVENTRLGLISWTQHPLLGQGVPPLDVAHGNRGLGLTAQSTWLELLIESGILGFAAFSFAVGWSLFRASQRTPKTILILVLAAIVPHFLVNLNFTATYPRLDYWLFFFFALRLLLESGGTDRIKPQEG